MNQTKQQIEDEYDKIVETASAKYEKITFPDLEGHRKTIDLAWAEYYKITITALAERERKLEELEDIKIIDGKKYRLVD